MRAGRNLSDFDTATVCGAMEYILCYAQQAWHRTVAFYAGTRFDNARYGDMVGVLYKLQ